jgi:hypothetical protein
MPDFLKSRTHPASRYAGRNRRSYLLRLSLSSLATIAAAPPGNARTTAGFPGMGHPGTHGLFTACAPYGLARLAAIGVTTGDATPTNSLTPAAVANQRFPEPSMATFPTGRPAPTYPEEPVMTAPLELNSLMVRPGLLETQTLPAPSMAILSAEFDPPPVYPVGLTGLPFEPNSLIVSPESARSVTQTLPAASIAIPPGPFIPPPLKGEPDTCAPEELNSQSEPDVTHALALTSMAMETGANCEFEMGESPRGEPVEPKMLMLLPALLATQTLPEPSIARFPGLSRPPPVYPVVAGEIAEPSELNSLMLFPTVFAAQTSPEVSTAMFPG